MHDSVDPLVQLVDAGERLHDLAEVGEVDRTKRAGLSGEETRSKFTTSTPPR